MKKHKLKPLLDMWNNYRREVGFKEQQGCQLPGKCCIITELGLPLPSYHNENCLKTRKTMDAHFLLPLPEDSSIAFYILCCQGERRTSCLKIIMQEPYHGNYICELKANKPNQLAFLGARSDLEGWQIFMSSPQNAMDLRIFCIILCRTLIIILW